MKKILSILFFLLAVAVLVWWLYPASTYDSRIYYGQDLVGSCGNYYQKNLVVENENRATVLIEVADDTCKTSLGLSGRISLEPNTGMWFEFPTESQHSFWMKDMNLVIDIIFFDQSFQVVEIAEQVLPESYNYLNPAQSQFFGQQVLSKYVLEVPAGWVKQNEIKLGDQVKIFDLI